MLPLTRFMNSYADSGSIHRTGFVTNVLRVSAKLKGSVSACMAPCCGVGTVWCWSIGRSMLIGEIGKPGS
jgi:hypothetical protein